MALQRGHRFCSNGEDHFRQRETLPIAGFAVKANKCDGFYLSRLKGSHLVYADKVDHGFDGSSTAELQARLKR